jgi:heme exporter protein C
MSIRLNPILLLVTVALLAVAAYMSFFYAPTERTMGEIQRIFYFHVGSFWTSFIAFFLNAVASVAYLVRKNPRWDSLAAASAEVGVLFCTGGLVMGPLWAKPVWGIWWTWDARLTLTLLLWMLYVAYLMLRSFLTDADRRATISAVYGVFALADVPLVYMANRWWRTQHPQPVIAGGEGSGLDPQMWQTVLTAWAALTALMVCYLLVRIALEDGRRRVEALRRQLRLEDAA